ncbi:MAG: hypothetical protein OQJ77_06570 [Thiovulaceae bacterium]|nr:hypothetical protein [Sulfurimonadaceae bacterium]MCW9026964.1 hypothetical protein [Sulfurimonadaceae bacterium]
MNPKKGLMFGLLFGFLVLGFLAMQRAAPEAKEDRIYKAIVKYSPYQYEKRLGGLSILNTVTGTKEKPSAAEVLHRKDELDKQWAKTHLKVENNDVIVMGDNNQTIVKIFIESVKEREFIKSFFGI